MRSALGKELRKQFASVMSHTFPDFVEIKAPSVWPGARMYVHRTSLASFFIRLVPCHNRDKFRVMFGWSSSGDFPCEALRRTSTEFSRDLLGHDGHEFRIMQPMGSLGLGREDRWWVLDDPTAVAFDRTLREFGKPGDTEIQTLERAMAEGLSYMMSIHRETPVEMLLPKIPVLIEDCMRHIQETVIPYFEKIKELRTPAA